MLVNLFSGLMLTLQYPMKRLLQELQLTLTMVEHKQTATTAIFTDQNYLEKNIFKRQSTGLKEQISVIILLFLIAPLSG